MTEGLPPFSALIQNNHLYNPSLCPLLLERHRFRVNVQRDPACPGPNDFDRYRSECYECADQHEPGCFRTSRHAYLGLTPREARVLIGHTWEASRARRL